MIQRLPLDYENLLSRWPDIIRSKAKTFFPNPWPPSIGPSKLQILKNVVAQNTDNIYCEKCRQCCLEFPFVCRPIEFFLILEHMHLHWPEGRLDNFFLNQLGILKEDGSYSCPFLTLYGCAIYEARPLMCRTAVAGEHLCNKRSRDFDGLGDWCNHEQVIKQLTTINLVNYYFDGNRSVELSWSVGKDKGALTIAPFEIWYLLLINNQETIERLLNLESYKPYLKWIKY